MHLFTKWFQKQSLKMPNNDSECSLEEAVFSLDHVREFIFEHCDRETLKNSRCVCRRWELYCSMELRKTVTFEFNRAEGHQFRNCAPVFVQREERPDRSKERRSLDQLVELMNNSNLAATNFPCNSFKFFQASFLNPAAQSFLNCHGNHIRKLELCGSGSHIVFEDVEDLILNQAPNLNHLILYGGSVIFVKPISMGGTSKNPRGNLNLKTIEIHRPTSEEIFSRFCDLVPKLKSAKLHRENLHFFVQPRNYLHLLNELSIDYTTKETLDSLEILGNNVSPENWAPEALSLNCRYYLKDRPHLWERTARVFNKILNGCAASCGKLYLDQIGFLNGLKIPPMAAVTKLVLIRDSVCCSDGEFRSMVDLIGFGKDGFFPEKPNFKKIFPNLKSVTVKCGNQIARISAGNVNDGPDFDSVFVNSQFGDN